MGEGREVGGPAEPAVSSGQRASLPALAPDEKRLTASKRRAYNKVMTKHEVLRLRRRMKLTQAQLAEEMGVHAMTVSKWERGTIAIPKVPAKLLRLLAAKGGR